jgi:hypothetical protein
VSLPKPKNQSTFFDVAFLLEALFGPMDRHRLFRQKVLPVLRRARPELAELYCPDNGRPAIEPVLSAGVTLLQFIHKVPDRQAAERLRLDLGWKYALDLELDYRGFHPSHLVHFRQQLAEAGKGRVVLDVLVEALREEGLIRKRSKVRLDSTHVLGLVAKMSRLEVVRETLRVVLEALERQGASEKLDGWELLIERYRDSQVDWRRQSKAQLGAKVAQAGRDALRIIAWARAQEASVWGHDKVLLLERVFLEQYELEAGEPQPREKEDSRAVKNPHDPEAQWSTKDTTKDKSWVGYKAQLMETVPEDGEAKPKGEPTEQFITDVVTTEAVASDIDGMHRMQAGQGARGEEPAPETHVDAAYISGETLAEAQAEGRELIGPALPSQRHKGCFPSEDFDVDIAARKAVCPAGKTSSQCSLIRDSHQDKEYYRFEWGSQCEECPLQSRCTTSKSGRRILSVGIHHDLLQQRRRDMKTEEFQARTRQRNAIEGTISEATRAGMRRTRYRGLAKTALANYFVAAACNVNRWLRRLSWQMECAPAQS